MHEVEVILHVKIGIPEDKRVTVGNIATAIKDLGDLPFSGIIIIDERWLPMGNGIFHFGFSAFDGITGRTILAEEYPALTEKEAEEFLRLLSKLVDVEFLVADDSMIQAIS